QKLIDDKLIIQESHRMELDRLPEIQQALKAFILRESVVKLHNEEIVNKASVSEEDIRNYYKKNYKDAPDEELEKIREDIKKRLRKVKEKERSNEYLKLLREQAPLKIHSELLADVKLDGSKEETEKLRNDKRPLVELYDSTMTMGDFAAEAVKEKQSPDIEKIKERIIDRWIDYKLVDHEALRRHYETDPVVKEMINDYRDQLMKNMFIKRIIMPKIEISDKILNDYYTSHQKDFLKPRKYRIQKIILKTVEDANAVLNSLRNGADFAWMAKNKSTEPSIDKDSGDAVYAVWLTKNELPEPAREIAETLKPGEISPVLELLELEAKTRYMIIRLVERTGDEVEKFSEVKDAVNKACFDTKFKELFDKYVDQLKADAEIKVHHDAIKSFEQRFRE
ncbi:MAG: peptidyl-prolyl cis-trans isomerase, partial [Nitrospirota bacterium]|nr:peptidyl-prolyl cis-trans isomerase [Nitrospirota bacterium]